MDKLLFFKIKVFKYFNVLKTYDKNCIFTQLIFETTFASQQLGKTIRQKELNQLLVMPPPQFLLFALEFSLGNECSNVLHLLLF